MKAPRFDTLTLEKIVGGGQSLGTLDDGRKAFVWGGLPGERVTIRRTKKKSHFVEGIVTEIHKASPERIEPLDPDSYLSTSPWQIMDYSAEQRYKAALIEEAFEMHNIVLPDPIEVYSNYKTTHYRNKVEFSWYGDEIEGKPTLDLAFFRRGSKGKIPLDTFSLLPESMMNLARQIRDVLHLQKVHAAQLKTLLIRCDQEGKCVWQLYVKEEKFNYITSEEADKLSAQGGEIIYSDPRSPASRITKWLHSFGDTVLSDEILGVPFHYATEGFFQINIPLYEQSLKDMKKWVDPNKSVIDFYSGVGSIGLTIGGPRCTLIEIDEHAVREMKRNIAAQASSAKAVLAPSEKALEYITGEETVIVDPPRAGLHRDVIEKLLATAPDRIIYLSCNPVTQARDVALLAEKYGVRAHRGYNFFPRTPHIEHLVILDLKPREL